MFKMWQIVEIYNGYKNLLYYKLGFFQESDCVEYKDKKKVCNKDCPLYSSILGVGYCNPAKTHEGENGCGCIIEAKLWSESPCPLGKF
jgi:hypothetical protein